MRKTLMVAVLMLSAYVAMAQNVQIHYDFGRNIYSKEEDGRPEETITFEHFKADGIGSWFYFIDLDIDNDGVVGAYAELSREFNFGKNSPWAAHFEYDGGLNAASVFQPASLVGFAWNGHSADFSKTYSLQLLYKRYYASCGRDAFNSVQLTGVWGLNFAGDKGTFSGFIDFWRDENPMNGHGKMVMLTEPQLWYNVYKDFSIGTEVEISNNFIFNTVNDKTFFVNPTLAVKYTF